MIGINKVILIGNIGKDPETVSFDGIKKSTFSLATTELHRCKDGSKTEETEWHNVVCWRGLAEVAEKFLKKGMQVYIEGRIKSHVREDKEGFKRRVVEIIAENLKILSRFHTGENPACETNNKDSASVFEEIIEEGFGTSVDDSKTNLSKLLSENTEIEKLGDLPF